MSSSFDSTRREFLKEGLVMSLGLTLSGCSLLQPAPKDVPAVEAIPDFSEANVLRHVVGIRPYRKKKVRLECTEAGDKVVIHNYGHGGAGFTVAWGCAEVVADMVRSRAKDHGPIAVLGGGVIGLSTARVLQEAGYSVSIYAEAFTPNTTSDLAGAQWSPSAIAPGETCYERGAFDEILTRSYRRYERMDGRRYGISRRLNYLSEEGFGGPIETLPKGLLPPVAYLRKLPFPGKPHRGKLYRTFLIEPPIYLPALTSDVRDAGATFTEKRFASESEINQLPEKIVVNCMGLGSGHIYPDPLLYPIRGQLVHLKPKPLNYLLIHNGYFFPRADAIVVGGTFEKGNADTKPNLALAKRILEVNRRFFRDS